MGLLPIIYTTLTIFTIGLTVIPVITYLLNRPNPNLKKPCSINSGKSCYIQRYFNPVYKRIPQFEELYINGKPKKKNSTLGKYYC